MGGVEVFGINAAKVEKFDTMHSAYAVAAIIAMTFVALAIALFEGFSISAGLASARLFSVAIVIVDIVSMPAYVLAQFGFLVLGLRWGSRFLAYVSFAAIGLGLLMYVLPIASETIFIMTGKNNATVELASFIGTSILSGIICAIFGAALLKAKKDRLVMIAGIVNIIIGGLYLTVLLSFLAILVNIPVMLLEAYLLYREGGTWKKNKDRIDEVNQARSTIVRTR